MRIARVDTVRCRGGENPLWDVEEQTLYFIDNTGKKAHRLDPSSGRTQTWEFPDVITTLVLRRGGGAVVTLRSGIHFFDFESGKLDLLLPLSDPPPFVFNDGKVDRRGRFIIGASTATFENPVNDGGLYRLDARHELTKLDGDIHYSNGPCFSPDDRTLYFADSWRKTIYAYDYYIENGAVSNRRPFVNTGELGGLPDGATVDADGNLWVAIYGGGKIAMYRNDGTRQRVIEMPVKLTSSVMFGGPAMDQLYVTTIEHGSMGEPVENGAGDLYVIEGLGVRGVSEPRYAG
jgi:sugar lactone lactonase YvrE